MGRRRRRRRRRRHRRARDPCPRPSRVRAPHSEPQGARPSLSVGPPTAGGAAWRGAARPCPCPWSLPCACPAPVLALGPWPCPCPCPCPWPCPYPAAPRPLALADSCLGAFVFCVASLRSRWHQCRHQPPPRQAHYAQRSAPLLRLSDGTVVVIVACHAAGGRVGAGRAAAAGCAELDQNSSFCTVCSRNKILNFQISDFDMSVLRSLSIP